MSKRRPRTKPINVAPAPVSMDMSLLNITALLEAPKPVRGQHIIGVRPQGGAFRLPVAVPAPGVLPDAKRRANDGIAMDDAGFNQLYSYAGAFYCGVGFPGYPYLAELYQRSEYRAPCDVTAKEMTRKWIKFITKGKTDAADKIAQLEAAFKKFGIRDLMRTAIEKDLTFGRSQIFIDVLPPKVTKQSEESAEATRELPLLIDKKTIAKDSLRGFKVIEPMWTSPVTYNSTDPMAADFYKPTAWYVMGRRVHWTRLITIISRPVPDMLKPSYNFGGISMIQLMEPYVNIWLRTRTSVADIIRNFSNLILKTDMVSTLAGKEGATGLLNRAKLFVASRDNQGLTLLNMGSEEMEQIAVPLSSLDQLQAQAQEHMAAPCHVPLVKLTGVTPSGLNASSEGEIQVFYDYIKGEQEAVLEGPLDMILDIVQLSEFGAIDEDIDYEFIELTEPTTKEKAEIRKSNGDSDINFINAGVVSPAEVREKLRTDPDSGYTGLTGELPDPKDVPGMQLPLDPNAQPEEQDDSDDGDKP